MKTIYPEDGGPLKSFLRSNGSRVLFFIFLAGIVTILLVVFPRALGFVEMAGREIRYLWWLILMVALGIWLVWGFRKSAK